MVRDKLAHLRIEHDIEDAGGFVRAYEEIEYDAKQKDEFARYQEELWDKRKRGIISLDEYQYLIAHWFKERGSGHQEIA